MAFTSTDLSNVESAIVSLSTGTQAVRVTVNGKSVEYQQSSLESLLRLRNVIQADVHASASGGPFNKVRFGNPT
ncbi:MAG: gpW family head-tail joining protein [Desulfobacterales bacterium]